MNIAPVRFWWGIVFGIIIQFLIHSQSWKEVLNIFFVGNSLFRNAWGVPDSKEIHFGDLANLYSPRAFLLQNVHLRVLSKFLIQDFEPKEVPDSKKKLTNRFGHEFCVRPEIFRSFGDVFSEISRIHFAK